MWKQAVYWYLKQYPWWFFFASWEDFLVKVTRKVLFSFTVSRSIGVHIIATCCHKASALLPNHHSSSILACWNGLHASFMPQDASPDRSLEPPQLPTIGDNSRTTSKQAVESWSYQQRRSTEKECCSFTIIPMIQMPAPAKRENEGKWGRSLNRLESCPNPWKHVIGLIFPSHQRNRLPVSYQS